VIVCAELKIGKRKADLLNQFHHLFWFGTILYVDSAVGSSLVGSELLDWQQGI